MTTTAMPPAAKIWEDTKLFVRRTLRSDFQKEQATPEERNILLGARRPIADPLAQDYVSWRRALLWVATGMLTIHAVFGLIDWIEALASDQLPGVLKWVMSLLYVRIPLCVVLLGLAALHWSDVRRSRRAARQGWMVLALTPIVISVIPFASFISYEELDPLARARTKAMTGGMIGTVLMFYVVPIVIGLMTGVMRSSMVLKTLLPESGAPGWGAVLAAPVYILVLLAMMVIVNQTTGTFLLFFGLTALIASPIMYLLAANAMTPPCTADEVNSRISPIRKRATFTALIGAALLVAFALEKMDIGIITLLNLASSYFASALTFTIVGADFLLALIFAAYKQSKSFHGTELAMALDAKFAALESVGLLKLHTEGKTTMMPMVGPPPPS